MAPLGPTDMVSRVAAFDWRLDDSDHSDCELTRDVNAAEALVIEAQDGRWGATALVAKQLLQNCALDDACKALLAEAGVQTAAELRAELPVAVLDEMGKVIGKGSVAVTDGVGAVGVDFAATRHSSAACTCHSQAKSEAMQTLSGLKKTLGFKLVTTDTQGTRMHDVLCRCRHEAHVANAC